MEAIKMNFAGVETDFPLLPPGWYNVTVSDFEAGETGPNSKHPGTPIHKFTLTVNEGEYNGSKARYNILLGKYLETDFGRMAPKSLAVATGKYTAKQLESKGFNWNPEEFIGSEMKALIQHQDYQGETRHQVKRVSALTEEDVLASASFG